MQLIQHPPATTEMVVLAVFCSTLTGILYPSPNLKSSETTADVDLLFCPCKIFPGIIAPKAEVSTRINVRESQEIVRGARMNPATVSSQSRQKVTKKEYSEDEELKKKTADDNQLGGVEGDTEKRKLCPCCLKFEPKVRFRNFSTSTSEPRPCKTEIAPKEPTSKQAATITEDNEVKPKCEVCSCPVCIKYENYFIHRALKHNRGGDKSTFVESNVMSDSNDSAEVTPDLNPTKCYCFKDKKDFNNELQLKSNLVSQEAVNKGVSSERCIICKCPLPQNGDNKEMAEESNNSQDRCAVCKCPIPCNVGSSGKDGKESREPSTPPAREQFYTDLDEYYGQLINCSDRQVRNTEIGRKPMKKPSSRLINQLQKKKWDFNEFEKKGTGIWDIKAAEWNRM